MADPLKTSIITSVYIVDELFRERARLSVKEPETEDLGQRASRLIDRLDKGLRELPDEDGGFFPGRRNNFV